jgi:lipopolysaccharide export system protein LptA
MKFRSGSSHRSQRLAAVGLLLAVAVAVAVLLYFLHYKKGGTPLKIVNTAIDGVDLTYLDFDKNNKKIMEIKCRESQKQTDDRLLMKKIVGTIFKSDKLEKDIHVTAESGIISNNLYNFDIRDHARIFSSDFLLASQHFLLENRELLSTREGVDFELKDVKGRADAGLEYFFNQNTLKLFACKGTLVKNGQPYDFQTETFWVIKKDNIMILQKKSELVGNGATVRADWISLQFDQGFANLQSVSSIGNCFFNMVENGENGHSQSKEITANFIRLDSDPDGRLQQITVHDGGKIALHDQKNNGQIVSENIEILLHSASQTLEKVKILTRGTLTNRGQDNITVSGDSMSALYSPDGILAKIKAENNCEFSTDDFQGRADAITYDAAHFMIEIAGKDAAIISKKNIFNSNHFLINSRRRQLSSDKDVKATIMPEKENVLFKAKPLFITAAGMEMTDKGDSIRFKGKVKLFQDDIELHSGEMLFDSRRSHISCHGNADLKFVNENDLVILRGQTIFFNSPERKIVITGNAGLNQAENILGGRQIELSFDRSNQLENILAHDNVTFSKKDLSGKSQSLHWYFNKKIVLFENSAQITKKSSGTTKGRELLLNLSTNEIKVSNQEDRVETIINQD